MYNCDSQGREALDGILEADDSMSFDHDAKWYFVRMDRNNRQRSTSRRHALEGSNLDTEARVVREAIQNSVDATLSGRKTEVVFKNVTLDGANAAEFKGMLRLDSDDSPIVRLDKLGLPMNNALETLDRSDDSPIMATIIEDWNTCGLGYDSKDDKDRFDELCLSFGQDRTDAAGGRGGSYGFGKEVYEQASDCNMFIVYSVFEPSEQTQEKDAHARLFGCATFDGHEFDNGSYQGRALFGAHVETGGQIECRPLVDEQAHEVAERLGFERRGPDDFGASIMILGSRIDMGKVKDAVELYWWPRMQSDELSVELVQNDNNLPSPEPMDNADLLPYIECYEWIVRDASPEGEKDFYTPQAISGRKPGKMGMVGLKKDPDRNSEDEDERENDLENTVALVRIGPKMVVEYMDAGGRANANYAAAFVSDPDADRDLHLSEPPSHDSWNPNSSRFDDFYPDPGEREAARRLVSETIKRIRARARRFQRELEPKAPPITVQGDRTLARMLARVISGRGLGTQRPPNPSPDPFEVRIEEGRTNGRSWSRITARVQIRLREDAPMDAADVDVTLVPSLVQDDNRARDSQGRRGLAWVEVDGARVEVEDDYSVRARISKDEWTVVEAKSRGFDRDLYASLEVEVRFSDAEAQRREET